MPDDLWTAERVVAASNEWVWVPDGATSTRTDEFVVAGAVVTGRGGATMERMDVLAFPIGPDLPDFGTPPDVQVRRVSDRETVADMLEVTADGFGERDVAPERHVAALNEARRGLEDDSVGMLVAYVDGHPAGTGGWTLAGPVCLTHGVVDTSSPILTGLGFARYGEERIVEQPLT